MARPVPICRWLIRAAVPAFIAVLPVSAQNSPDRPVAAVPVAATSDGAHVTDLRAEDFVVIQDGAEAGVERLESPDAPFNAVFVVDTSPANDLGLDWVRGVVSGVVERLDPGTRIALIEAQSPPRDFGGLTRDRGALLDEVDRLENTGRPTNRIYDRVVDAYLMLLDEGTPRGAVVVLTDGIDVGSDRGEESFLRALRVAGMPLYVLATDNAEGYSGGLATRSESVPGGERFRAALSTIADQSEQFYDNMRQRWRERAISSGGAIFEVGIDPDSDRRAIERLAAQLNSTYTIYFDARPPSPGSDHTGIGVRVDRPGVEILAPGGIWWPEP